MDGVSKTVHISPEDIMYETYDLLGNDKKAFTTSKTEVEQAVIDKILEEYPNLTEPYSVTSVSEDEIIFVKDGKEFVISNEQD